MRRPQVTLRTLLNRAKNEGWRDRVRSAADEHALMNGCWFSQSRADHVCGFFPKFLRHSKGEFARQPFHLLDWQREELLSPLFGWVRRNANGKVVRRYRKAYVEVPKKNGKSTLAAGIGLYMLVGDGEAGAEVYSAGCDRGQARIVFDEAVNMVKASPELQDMLTVNNHIHRIIYPDETSYWAALSADSDSNQGKNAHCMICDELHAWYGRENYDSLKWAFAVRAQSLLFQITTAPDDPQSVCTEQRNYAISVNDGTVKFPDDQFFGLIYAADPKDDPFEEATWFKANPSLGTALPLENFRNDAEEAKNTPATIDAFKRYRLDIPSTGDHALFNTLQWDKCGKRKFDWNSLRGERCFAGLDLSKTQDSTSLQLWFPLDGEDYALLSFFWLPEESAREQNNRVSWLLWAKEGYVELTAEEVTDFRAIKRKLVELSEIYHIEKLLYDPWQAEHLTQEIEEEIGIPRMAFPQTLKNFAPAVSDLERLLKKRKIFHQQNKCMDWQMGNCRGYVDPNGNKRPTKPKPEDYRKIDGPISLLEAIAGAGTPEESGPSIYESPDSERVCLL